MTEARTADVRFAERSVEADGFRIRYLEAGEGEPLVCLHGAAGLRVSRGHEILAERHRVIALEVPGFGESPENDRSASMRDLAATMTEAVTALGIHRFDLLGNSFGGRLALWMTVLQPERIRTLVLVAPAAILPEDRGQAGPPMDPNVLSAHPERLPPRPPLDPAIVEKQLALVRRLAGPPRDPELEGRLPDLDVPVLVLFGTSDRVIPPEMGRHYREMLPNCQYVLVYDAGHLLDADRPEAFAAVVEDFVQRPDGFLVTRKSGLLNP
ncbi:MAG: alpha/beta fold hydrolase [Streptosporangiales bacterium]|nr:alpha/beta fold hydrolase [Streptosporangiales bacterium]